MRNAAEHDAKVAAQAREEATLAVLDDVFSSMDTFFGNIPMDAHIIKWAVSKQDSFVTSAMATYLHSRKLRESLRTGGEK
jgi:hypothetical protein